MPKRAYRDVLAAGRRYLYLALPLRVSRIFFIAQPVLLYYCINTRGGMILFTLNPSSGIPIYRQLIEQVRRMVASGQLQPGNEMPSVRELALTHAVNPMTISKAYSLLENEGLLERQRGKAMTIAPEHGSKETKTARLHHLQPALDHLVMAARQLQLNPDDVVKALKHAMENDND